MSGRTPMVAVCKYAPLEMLEAFGAPCVTEVDPPDESADAGILGHENLCGFGKALLAAAVPPEGGAPDGKGALPDMLLTDCCDVTRRVFDAVAERDGHDGNGRFLHLMGLPHSCGPCQVDMLAFELERLCAALEGRFGKPFDLAGCQRACRAAMAEGAGPDGEGDGRQPYIALLGVRASADLVALAENCLGMPVRDLTCMGLRRLAVDEEALAAADRGTFFQGYARALLGQVPCMRMAQTGSRRGLLEDPGLSGIVYHTVSFCDFYGREAFELQRQGSVPVLALETDYTTRGIGQLRTRLEAFAETMGAKRHGASAGAGAEARGRGGAASKTAAAKGGNGKDERNMDDTAALRSTGAGLLFAGIDSGSTSTDVVIVDASGAVVAQHVVPTGGSAVDTGRKCLAEALAASGIPESSIAKTVATGYGREYLQKSDGSVTEITCHARGARELFPHARTIIDIGGQDSKAIALAEDGTVANFAMNDKCAAGTGRFLEMMARTLQMPLDEFARAGMRWNEDVTISSMCSVFAESEVVSLVAQSKAVPDIVHGLNDSIAKRTVGLLKRVGGLPPFCMTGGVALNKSVVAAIEARLGHEVSTSADSQMAGALGAALIARDTA